MLQVATSKSVTTVKFKTRAIAVDWLVVGLFALEIISVVLPLILMRHLLIEQQPYWYFGWGLIYAIGFGLASRHLLKQSEKAYQQRWLALIVLIVLPQILNVWVRFIEITSTTNLRPLFGRDFDVSLYLTYGHQFNNGQVPNFFGTYMEYPQGALFIFALAEKLAGGQIGQTFFWVFPLVMIAFQLMGAASVYGIGLKLGRARIAFLLAIFSSGAIFLLQYYDTRFDMAPTAMLLAAIYFFIPSKNHENFVKLIFSNGLAAGLLIGWGFTTKWLPAVAAVFLFLGLLQAKKWRIAAWFTIAASVFSLVVLLPFFFWNSAAFWYPVVWQSTRKMTGESFWYTVQYYFLDHHKRKAWPLHPYDPAPYNVLGDQTLVLIQLAMLLILIILAALRFWNLGKWVSLTKIWTAKDKFTMSYFEGWAAMGLLGVVVFTLANRVFSVQFMILILWCFAAILVLRPVGWKSLTFFFVLVTVAGNANFLVFALMDYPKEWLYYTGIFFVVIWLVVLALVVRTVKFSGKAALAENYKA